MKQINFTEIIDELNEYIFSIEENSVRAFSYMTNGYSDAILFGEEIIWDSENDDREFIEELNDYEDFLPFIKRQFNNYINNIEKFKF